MKLIAATFSILMGVVPVGAQCLATEVVKLVAPGPEAGANFGRSVALSGNVLLVGAPMASVGGLSQKGAVYVYRFNGSTWGLEQVLVPGVPAGFLGFGSSVAVDGDVAVVGSPQDSAAGFQSGRVTVFRHTGAAWVEEQQLVPAAVDGFDQWGSSVSIRGNVLVGGAPFDGCGGNNCGSAIIFRYEGGVWVQVGYFLLQSSSQEFGRSVSTDGQRALVGGPGPGFPSNPGEARVLRAQGASWVTEQLLTPPAGATSDEIGFAVALDGGDCLVGAPGDNGGFPSAGSAYFFELQGQTWQQVANPGGSSPAARLGKAVALRGGVAAIGSPGSSSAKGQVELYRNTGIGWVSLVRLKSSDAAPGDVFGESVATDGATVAVGAPSHDPVGFSNAGAVYLFAVPALALGAEPLSAVGGGVVTLTTCGGLPCGLNAIFLTEFGGVPQLLPLFFGTFDAEGRTSFVAPVPLGLSGFSAMLTSFGHYLPATAGASDPVSLTFQ